MKKIAIIGECMIELSGKAFGSMVQFYGGDTLNTATYLARISNRKALEVSYISALGTDSLSEQMLAFWQQDGINTDYVLRDVKRLPGLYLIELDPNGERTFLNWRSESAARYLLQHSDYVNVSQYLNSCDMVYLSGISLAILPKEDREKFIEQLIQLHQKGIKIVFDSNYRPVLWDNIEEAQYAYRCLLPSVDIALVTQEDEQLLWGDENIYDTQERLKSFGIPNIVIKAGKDGAYYCSGYQLEHIPTTSVEKVVDTTSAGDAFNAGFISGYLAGKSMVSCCEQGNQLAGIVIQHKGAIVPANAVSYLKQKFQ